MSAPAAKARVPLPVTTTARQSGSPSSCPRAAARPPRTAASSALRASGRSIVSSATAGSGSPRPNAAGAGRSIRTTGRAAAGAATRSRSPRAGTVSVTRSLAACRQYPLPRNPPRALAGFAAIDRQPPSGTSVVRRLEDDQGDQPRGDLAEVPAARPHGVRGQAGVERRPIVKGHRGDQAQVGPADEPVDDAIAADRPKTGRLDHEGQVGLGVGALERGQRIGSAVRASEEGKQRGHIEPPWISVGRSAVCHPPPAPAAGDRLGRSVELAAGLVEQGRLAGP